MNRYWLFCPEQSKHSCQKWSSSFDIFGKTMNHSNKFAIYQSLNQASKYYYQCPGTAHTWQQIIAVKSCARRNSIYSTGIYSMQYTPLKYSGQSSSTLCIWVVKQSQATPVPLAAMWQPVYTLFYLPVPAKSLFAMAILLLRRLLSVMTE